MMNEFGMTQQAVDTALGYFDSLRANGKTSAEATDHVALRYGVRRDALATLRARRSLGLLGDSGETVYGCIATSQQL